MDRLSITNDFLVSSNLGQSKRILNSIGYALKALMYIESVCVARFTEFDDKITVGLGIGFTADAYGKTHNRLMQMNTSSLVFESSTEIEALFKDVAVENDHRKIKSKIYAITRELCSVAQKVESTIHHVYDFPTLETIRAISSSMEAKLKILTSEDWVSDDVVPSFLIDPNDMTVPWNYSGVCPVTVEVPGRPAVLRMDGVSILNAPSSKLIQTQEGLQRLLHFIYADIEVLAAEVCAKNISDYGEDMPLQFSLDMARQVSDECRHAIMIRDALHHAGGQLGDFTYTNRVWSSYIKGSNLAEKLAIQQVVDEGNGLDTSAVLVRALTQGGREDLVNLYEFLMADETVHCAFGNRWLAFLNKGAPEKYVSVIDQVIQKTGSRVPGGAPVNVEGRRAAEYPEWFIQERLLGGLPAVKP